MLQGLLPWSLGGMHALAQTGTGTAPTVAPDTAVLIELAHAVDSLVRASSTAALPLARKEYALALPLAGSKWAAMADRDMGSALNLAGHADCALAHYRSAMERFDALGMGSDAAACLERMATLNVVLGNYSAATELLDRTMRSEVVLSEPKLMARCEYALGYLNAEREQIDVALGHFERSRSIASAASIRKAEALAVHGMARVLCMRGAYENALATYDTMIALSMAADDALLQAQGIVGRAGVLEELGRTDGSRKDYESGLSLLTGLNNRPWMAFVHGRIASAALSTGDLATAEEHALAGLALSKLIGAKRDVADLYEVLYRLNERAGRSDRALDYMKHHVDASVDFARTSGNVSLDQLTGQLAITEQFYADSLSQTHVHYRRLLDAGSAKSRTYARWFWFAATIALVLLGLVLVGRRA
ncbi:MAG: hypothetical protein IPJ76_13475 [Flavobacteriales bacterium]|nr:MAG: hypothetical protein IPJ76_13475 [Flavobacteriales bacterium]